MTAVVIREVGREGAAVVAALYGMAFGDAHPGPVARALMETPAARALIACENTGPGEVEPVGYIVARVAGGEGEILSLGVAPVARCRGVGRALVAAFLERAGAAGAATVFLEVGEDNRAARALYRGCGFRQVGRRRDYYRRRDNTRIDALIMRRPVKNSESC